MSSNPNIYFRERSGAKWDWKGRFGLWRRRLLDFLFRSNRESCPNKKNAGRKNAISIYIWVANSFTSEHVFFVTKLLFCNTKFFFNHICLVTVLFLEFCPCQFRPECPMAAAPLCQNHKRKNHENIQTQTPGSAIFTLYPYCTHVLLLWEMVITNKKQSNLYAEFFLAP